MLKESIKFLHTQWGSKVLITTLFKAFDFQVTPSMLNKCREAQLYDVFKQLLTMYNPHVILEMILYINTLYHENY